MRQNIFLMSPPPLWRDGIFRGMSQRIINQELPVLLADVAHELGTQFISISELMLKAQVITAALD